MHHLKTLMGSVSKQGIIFMTLFEDKTGSDYSKPFNPNPSLPFLVSHTVMGVLEKYFVEEFKYKSLNKPVADQVRQPEFNLEAVFNGCIFLTKQQMQISTIRDSPLIMTKKEERENSILPEKVEPRYLIHLGKQLKITRNNQLTNN